MNRFSGAGGTSTTTPRKLRQMRSAATPSTPPTPAKQNITEITPQRLTERLEQQLNALATKAQVRVGLAQSVAAVTASVREVLRRWQQSTNLALHGVSCLEDELAHQLLTIRKQSVQLKQRDETIRNLKREKDQLRAYAAKLERGTGSASVVAAGRGGAGPAARSTNERKIDELTEAVKAGRVDQFFASLEDEQDLEDGASASDGPDAQTPTPSPPNPTSAKAAPKPAAPRVNAQAPAAFGNAPGPVSPGEGQGRAVVKAPAVAGDDGAPTGTPTGAPSGVQSPTAPATGADTAGAASDSSVVPSAEPTPADAPRSPDRPAPASPSAEELLKRSPPTPATAVPVPVPPSPAAVPRPAPIAEAAPARAAPDTEDGGGDGGSDVSSGSGARNDGPGAGHEGSAAAPSDSTSGRVLAKPAASPPTAAGAQAGVPGDDDSDGGGGTPQSTTPPTLPPPAALPQVSSPAVLRGVPQPKSEEERATLARALAYSRSANPPPVVGRPSVLQRAQHKAAAPAAVSRGSSQPNGAAPPAAPSPPHSAPPAAAAAEAPAPAPAPQHGAPPDPAPAASPGEDSTGSDPDASDTHTVARQGTGAHDAAVTATAPPNTAGSASSAGSGGGEAVAPARDDDSLSPPQKILLNLELDSHQHAAATVGMLKDEVVAEIGREYTALIVNGAFLDDDDATLTEAGVGLNVQIEAYFGTTPEELPSVPHVTGRMAHARTSVNGQRRESAPAATLPHHVGNGGPLPPLPEADSGTETDAGDEDTAQSLATVAPPAPTATSVEAPKPSVRPPPPPLSTLPARAASARAPPPPPPRPPASQGGPAGKRRGARPPPPPAPPAVRPIRK